jgi:transposase
MSISADRMRQIVREEHPEVVARLLASMQAENERLREVLRQIETEKALREQAQLNFEENLRILRREIFGKSSERRVEATDRPPDKSQTDALIFSQSAYPAPESRENAKAQIPKEIIEHVISDESLRSESAVREIANPAASQWQELKNVFDDVTLLQVHERRYVLELHRKKKYKLKSEFNTSDKDVILTAEGPSGLLPGMNYTTEFVASVVADKYISHMPLERQTREMESLGVKNIKTSTLSRLCALAAVSLESIQKDIFAELKSSDLALHLDETTWNIQNKNQNDGYMWIISNRYGSHYTFKPTRSGKVIKELLTDYAGPVLTDGYEGYNALDEADIKQGFCWAHARRKFFEIESHDPTVTPILNDIDDLFKIERRAKDFSELKILRERESRIVVDRLNQRLMTEYAATRDGSQKRKAIVYITKRWEGFTYFLTDTRLPLSNNEAERTIRHAVVGRKNYYGAATHGGADTAATLFTIIESCKKNDIDPRTFLLMSLQAAARDEKLITPLAYARQLRQ